MKLITLALLFLFSSLAYSHQSLESLEQELFGTQEEVRDLNLWQQIKQARKEYKSIKKTHKTEIREFLQAIKKFRHQLNDQSHLYSAFNNPSINPLELKKALAQDLKGKVKFGFVDACGNYMYGPDWHLGVFGKKDLLCTDVNIESMTIGPGLLYQLMDYMVIACLLKPDIKSNPKKVVDVGVMAEANAIIGVKTGVYFGSHGVCLLAGASGLGLGAFAGVQVLNFKPL